MLSPAKLTALAGSHHSNDGWGLLDGLRCLSRDKEDRRWKESLTISMPHSPLSCQKQSFSRHLFTFFSDLQPVLLETMPLAPSSPL